MGGGGQGSAFLLNRLYLSGHLYFRHGYKEKKGCCGCRFRSERWLKGGKARAKKLSAEELSEQGRNAVKARWAKYYSEREGRSGESSDNRK
jgi:hypothetical protein